MKHPPRRRRRIIISSAILALLTVSYTAVFARELRCQFVGCSDLKEIGGNVYVDPLMRDDQIARLRTMLQEARARDAEFFGDLRSAPVIIAGADEKVMEQYGSAGNRTAVTHIYFGHATIVLGPDGLNTDVIAHEMMHAELSERTGWLRREMHIPVWFDEGLAMQTDYRAEYSEEEWRKATGNGTTAPPLKTLESRDAFASDDYWNCYATSKHEVMRWHTIVGRDGLNRFLQLVGDGEDFGEMYGRVEEEFRERR